MDSLQDCISNPYLPKRPTDEKHVFGEDGRSYRCSLCGVYNRTDSPPFHEPCEGQWAQSGKLRYAAEEKWQKELPEWRKNRETGWFYDIGYSLQDVIRRHRYDYDAKTIKKPDDRGWNACSCGQWEGYWTSFEPHVADHLRACVIAKGFINPTI